jgi:hypothetical protein
LVLSTPVNAESAENAEDRKMAQFFRVILRNGLNGHLAKKAFNPFYLNSPL